MRRHNYGTPRLDAAWAALAGEPEAGAHEPFTGRHRHEHAAYGHESADDDGRHVHEHAHDGDAAHGGAGHREYHTFVFGPGYAPPPPGYEQSAGRWPAPPGAALDGQPWARSWAGFLAATGDGRDKAGARRVIAAAMSERVPSDGGFLLPERLRSQVLAYMTSAVVRPRAMVVPMPAYRVALPRLDNPDQSGGAQALGGLTFAITEDGQDIPVSSWASGRAALEARKVAALLQDVPNELADDAAAAFGDLLSRVVAAGLAWYEDDSFLNGTGSGEPEGLLNAEAALAVSRASAGTVGHADIVGMLGALHPASQSSATWLLGADAFSSLLELYEVVGTAPAGQMIPPPGTLRFDPLARCWRLLGVEAVVTDHQPAIGSAGDVVLADLSLYVIGDRQVMQVERSQLGQAFPADASDFKITVRQDGRFWPSGPWTTSAGQHVSPLVVLS